jgi:hypothetical protein
LLMQVLEWRKAHLGMGHPNTYRTMDELAITLRQLGELAEARGLEVQFSNGQQMVGASRTEAQAHNSGDGSPGLYTGKR